MGIVAATSEQRDGAILLALTRDHGFRVADLVLLAALLPAGLVLRRLAPAPSAVARARGVIALAATGAVLLGLGLASLVGERARPPVLLEDAGLVLLVGGAAATTWSRSWSRLVAPLPVTALVVGLAVDVRLRPTGTAFGAVLLGAAVSARSAGRAVRLPLAITSAGLCLANLASMADVAGVDVVLSASGGGSIRSLALGAVVVAATAEESLRVVRAGTGAP